MQHFHTTRWSLIDTLRDDPAHASQALEELCRAYRAPVLAYVRKSGYNRVEAEDLTQEYFVQFLQRGWYTHADPVKGRFRSLLVTTVRRFLIDRQSHAHAIKRGGGRRPCAIDPAMLCDCDASPERAFTRAWIQTVVQRSVDRLRREWHAAGKADRFERLAPLILEAGDGEELQHLSTLTGVSCNTLSAQVSRLRGRLRQLVRLELLHTVGSGEALEIELRELRTTLLEDTGLA